MSQASRHGAAAAALGALLLLALAASVASCRIAPGKVEEDDMFGCSDLIDDDGDGLTDCEDPDCAAFCPGFCGNGTCEPEAGETCAGCAADCTTCACTSDGMCSFYEGETCAGCTSDCSCGTGDCGTFVDCLAACATPTCPEACWEATCYNGQEQYVAVADCQQASCGADCDPVTGTPSLCMDCTMTSCQTELTACLLGGC